MKIYCFVEIDIRNNIISFPYPYYSIYQDIPCPFFILEDVKNHNGFNSICKTTMKKIINGKIGSIIRLGNLCKGSNWGPLYHAIYIVDENNILYSLTKSKENLDNEIKNLKKQLHENDLYKELMKKEQERASINKKFKEIVKR